METGAGVPGIAGGAVITGTGELPHVFSELLPVAVEVKVAMADGSIPAP